MSKRTNFLLFISLVFFLLVLANYFINLNILKTAINDLEKHAIKNSSERIIEWLEEKIDTVDIVEKSIISKDHIKDYYYIQNLIKHSSLVADFSYMFIGYEDQLFITSKTWKKPSFYNTKSASWYQKTINNNDITITEPYISTFLNNEVVISICKPTKDNKNKKGVLCGVLPLKNIESELLKISLPYNGSIFLVDRNRKILVHKDKKKLLKTFTYNHDSKQSLKTTDYRLKNYIFSQGLIKCANWHLVLQLDKKKVHQKVNLQLKINLAIYTISLALFLWLNLFYNRYQKMSEDKLKTSKMLLHLFIESDNKGFLLIDEKFNIKYYNKYFAKLLGIEENNLKKVNVLESHLFFKRPPLWITDCLKKIFLATKEKEKTFSHKFSFIDNKEKVFLFFTSIPIKNDKKEYTGSMIIVDDITKKEMNKKEKKEQEDILFQQKKMADLGEMIGAISHQWKQPLNSLSILLCNLLQFKQMNCLDEQTFNDNLKYAISSTKYLTNTIDTFRDFYLPHKKIQSFDILDAINNTLFILEPYFKNSNINISIEHKNEKYPCYNYKNEFQQIIANLMLNAKEVLQENKSNKNMSIKIIIENGINEYNISIIDNGTGIKSSIKDELFTPFKTTKGDKGTGSGLYISQLIARKKLLGDLTLTSNKNPTIFLLKMAKKLENEHFI